jgi:hypothetical protein
MSLQQPPVDVVESKPSYPDSDHESGYASGSGSPSEASLPEIHFTKSHLAHINRNLQNLEPQGTLISSDVDETRH